MNDNLDVMVFVSHQNMIYDAILNDEIEHEIEHKSSDEEIETPEDDFLDDEYYNKDRNVFWTKQAPQQNNSFPFTDEGKTGSTHTPGRTPVEIFKSFITPEIGDTIVKFTNLSGKIKFKNKWKDININGFYTYLGIIVACGCFGMNSISISDIYTSNELWSIPFFSESMSRNQFTRISGCLRFDDKSTREEKRRINLQH